MQARLERVRRRSILLYEAAAAGGCQIRAQFCGLICRGEWTHHRAKEDALGAEVGAADDRRTPAEQVRIFGLQVAERGLRFVFATLRRNLNGIAAASRYRRYRCCRGCLVGRRFVERCRLSERRPWTFRRGGTLRRG